MVAPDRVHPGLGGVTTGAGHGLGQQNRIPQLCGQPHTLKVITELSMVQPVGGAAHVGKAHGWHGVVVVSRPVVVIPVGAGVGGVGGGVRGQTSIPQLSGQPH